jgi:hypothetical protein
MGSNASTQQHAEKSFELRKFGRIEAYVQYNDTNVLRLSQTSSFFFSEGKLGSNTRRKLPTIAKRKSSLKQKVL